MHDVNWWLMAAAFLLGLVLTSFLMIGRATSEEADAQAPADEERP